MKLSQESRGEKKRKPDSSSASSRGDSSSASDLKKSKKEERPIAFLFLALPVDTAVKVILVEADENGSNTRNSATLFIAGLPVMPPRQSRRPQTRNDHRFVYALCNNASNSLLQLDAMA